MKLRKTTPIVVSSFIVLYTILVLTGRTPPIARAAESMVGDANGDGSVSLADFQAWRNAYLSASTPTATPAPQSSVISVLEYGAKGDGSTDSTSALRKALQAAKPGMIVQLPEGTFIQSDTLEIPSGVTFEGTSTEKSILKATNPNKEAVYLRGKGATIQNITLTSTATVRGLSNQHHRVVAERGASDYTVQNIHIVGGAGAGIFSQGGSGYTIKNNTVVNTLADGIHNTGGGHDAEIIGNTVRNSGDDAIAVVSYLPDGDYTRNIMIANNTIQQSKSRGISVVGGTDVTIKDNTITQTVNAGIYLACETSYNTFANKRLLIQNNTISQANSNTSINHAGIFMYSRGGSGTKADGTTVTFVHEDITISNNTVSNTVSAPWHVAFLDTNAARIKLQDNTISGSGSKVPFLNNTGSGVVTASGNTFNGNPL